MNHQYTAAFVVRLVLVMLFTGYIHPDEYMQSLDRVMRASIIHSMTCSIDSSIDSSFVSRTMDSSLVPQMTSLVGGP